MIKDKKIRFLPEKPGPSQVVPSNSEFLRVGYKTKPRRSQGYGVATLPASFSVSGVTLLFNSAKSISFVGVLPDVGAECPAFGVPGTEH